jgi:hypothetical protein
MIVIITDNVIRLRLPNNDLDIFRMSKHNITQREQEKQIKNRRTSTVNILQGW